MMAETLYAEDRGDGVLRTSAEAGVAIRTEIQAIDFLTAHARLATFTRDAVRKAIQRSLDQGRELDRLQAEFRTIAAELDTLEPCGLLMSRVTPGEHSGSSCRWCELQDLEQRVTRRIDDVRRMLGVIP